MTTTTSTSSVGRSRDAPDPRGKRGHDMTETSSKPPLTPAQQRLNDLWEKHLREEFVTRDTEATLDTMVPDAYVNHVPVMTGGLGHHALRAFYSTLFIPQMPPDTETVPPSPPIAPAPPFADIIFPSTP